MGEQRSRRPSSVLDVAQRTRRQSLIHERASSRSRELYAASMTTAVGFTHPIVEHITLFKVKADARSEQKAALIEGLLELRKLDGVLLLTVGQALSVQGAEYTHVLHGRFRNKACLASYLEHPDYSTVMKLYMDPLTEDILVLNWECIPKGPFIENIGAKRITLLKIKESTPEADVQFLEDSIEHLPSKCPTAGQASAGTNFTTSQAKGYTYAILELFPSTTEEEEVFASVEHTAWQDSKIRPIATSLIIVDYHAD